ncbi:hypothetical protein [Collinsella sp. Sow4_E3]|uniref:hypothetical protein n=1 Tax=Collinsella sp. Sow4_E3 TaxID=3438776 RepID=UPI003F908141
MIGQRFGRLTVTAVAAPKYGATASSWSYAHTDANELTCGTRKSPYSLDPTHYEPRCASCHKRFDLDHHNQLAAIPAGATN